MEHHQAAFITMINFLYRAILVVEHTVGWFQGHQILR
jgi:hypothetical protein